MKVTNTSRFSFLSLIGFFLFGIALVFPVRAQDSTFITGAELFALCEKDQTACDLYAGGWTAAYFAIYGQAVRQEPSLRDEINFVCVPDGFNRSVLGNALKDYLISNPSKRRQLASTLVFEALSETYPCP